MKYQSVIGFGKASFIDDPKSKEQALNIIMAHYGGDPSEYPQTNLERTLIIRVDIERMTGRQST